MSSNGRLSQSELAPITKGAEDNKQAYLRKDAAAAFMAMNAESERVYGVTLRPTSARTAYRTYADQVYFDDQYRHHGGALAAKPGTSNHGLGLAIDFPTQQMIAIVLKIGEKYGWAKKWSDAPSEPWHHKWKVGKYKAVGDPRWRDYTPEERRWIEEYDRLLKTKKDPERRAVLRRVMTEQRKKVWQAAQGPGGWHKLNRQARYNSLLARTKT